MNGRRDNDGAAELAGGYALNALDAEERAEFEAYLAQSENGRTEAAELSDAAVALGLAVAPVQPSAGLRAALMAQLTATPQVAPLPASPAHADDSTSLPTFSRPVLTTNVDSDAALPPSRRSAGAGSADERAQHRWFQRPARIMFAAAAAAVLFVGGTVAGQAFNNNQFEQAQAAGLVQISAASDSQRSEITMADGHEATLVWSNNLGLSAVLVEDLPALSSDQDYQLWYINGSGAASAGTFDSSGIGTAWRVLDGAMHSGDTVGITVEPKGGSKQPSSAPIVAFQS